MLHNSGPYGPNDAPINMGNPVNMTQMPQQMNIGHNLSNLGKIAQQTPQTASSHYSLPDYAAYGHPPLGMPSQMSPFQSYNPIGYQPNYLVQNPSSVHDTSWQNGMLPMNLNTQGNHGSNLLDYPLPYDKRPVNPIGNSDFKEQNSIRKNLPINIPQAPLKSFQKLDNDSNYGLFNVNQDRFNRYNPHLELSKSEDKPLLDSSRRRSLENTVRLIENILINTTKNKELQRNQDLDKIDKTLDRSSTQVPKPAKHIETVLDVSKVTETQSGQKTVLTVEKDNLTTNNEQIKDNTESDEETKDDEEIKDDEFKNDEELITESEQTSESEDDESKPIESKIENVVIKTELGNELDPDIVIKVEPVCWSDTEYVNPFLRDINATPRDCVGNSRIVDPESSVNEAMAVVSSGSNSNAHFECPHCNLIFKHPKRFLIHTNWHSFGLTYDKRMEMVKQRELKRNQRKEARVVDRMNSREVTDTTSGSKVYQCKDCDKAFSSKGSLKNHRQRFHPTRVRECKICRKTVLGWMALRAHLATHTNETGYQCADCPKKFKYAHSLAKHRDTHLEKTLSCEQCPKKFGSNQQLKMHQKVHERAQRGATFRCSYCAKGFYESYNLAVHERTHRNERPFNCDICNTSFGTNSSLKRHLKVSHSTSKPYECSTCHRSFVTESIRDRHELRQHGDPEDFKFTCDQCECRYLKLKDLQKHVYKAHPKGKRKKKVKSDSE